MLCGTGLRRCGIPCGGFRSVCSWCVFLFRYTIVQYIQWLLKLAHLPTSSSFSLCKRRGWCSSWPLFPVTESIFNLVYNYNTLLQDTPDIILLNYVHDLQLTPSLSKTSAVRMRVTQSGIIT